MDKSDCFLLERPNSFKSHVKTTIKITALIAWVNAAIELTNYM